jgi:hypothetical protein
VLYRLAMRHAQAGSDPAPTLGVDIGGVIIPLDGSDEDTAFFGDHPMRTPAVAGAFDALAALVAEPFQGRVHLISKAGTATAERTRAWLGHHEFFDRTGIALADLHFVAHREDKAPLAAELGVTHFVDDRLDILETMAAVAHRYLFVGGGRDHDPDRLPQWAVVGHTWPQLSGLIASSIRPRRAAGTT